MEKGKQNPARGPEGRARQIVQELDPPAGQEGVHQGKEDKQQQKSHQGFEIDQQGGKEGRRMLQQVIVDGRAEHQIATARSRTRPRLSFTS